MNNINPFTEKFPKYWHSPGLKVMDKECSPLKKKKNQKLISWIISYSNIKKINVKIEY